MGISTDVMDISTDVMDLLLGTGSGRAAYVGDARAHTDTAGTTAGSVQPTVSVSW